MTPEVLILFAHPALEKSRVNLRLLEAVRTLPGVTVNDLYQLYPDFDIDVRREQHLLEEHRTVVLQHPFYWYSSPPLVKQWEDLVLEHGWAYGHDGTALRGKRMMTTTTAGGGEDSYRRGGHNHYTIAEFLAPLERTAALCDMIWLEPFVVYGTHSLDDAGIARYAAEYRKRIEELLESVDG